MRFLCAVLVVFLTYFPLAVQAQLITDYVSVSPAESWVVLDKIPASQFELAQDMQVGYQLLSYQSKILLDDKHRYRRFVLDLQTQSGVEDNGTITVTFDPSFQTIIFHHVDIIRDGKRLPVLDLEKVEIYRVETDRDKLLYNGDLQIGFAVPGLAEGDRLDYAYTLSGVNPALRGAFYDRQSFAFSIPVRLLRKRLLIDPSFDIYSKNHNQSEEPERGKSGRYNTLEWQKTNIEAVDTDDNVPYWQYTRPVYETSSVKDWSYVGAHFSPYYNVTLPIPSGIQQVIDEISARSDDPKRRAREALDFVQSNIRYLGIELGEGGFIPRSPELVLERRFGDCKDVTFLLLTLLKGLGVKADPILVNTLERGEFIQSLPGLSLFNHVLVRATIDGEDYYLDATRGKQLGDIDSLDQGSFGRGLVLTGNDSFIVDAAKTNFAWRKDFIDEYDLVGHSDDIALKIQLNYFGEDADSNRDWHESNGLQSVEKDYLDYFADFYPTIERTKPTEVTANETKGSFSVTLYYIIKNAWDKDEDSNSKTFWAIPYEVKADMPEFSGAKRTLPFALEYPVKTRQRIQYLVDDTWEFSTTDTKLDNDYISYLRKETFDGKVYQEEYSFVTQRDHLPSEGFAEIMKEIEQIRDDYGSVITMPITPSTGWEAWSEETWGQVFVALFFLSGMFAAIGAALQNNYDKTWREHVVLHPVSLKKFIFLSLLTIGHYQIYWFYKNWQWVKTVGREDLWPVARSFFASIMNFVLFRKIAEVGSEKSKVGYGWYGAVALPLAFLYLMATGADRVISRMDNIPEWTSFITIIALFIAIPVVMQVNRYNIDKPEYVAKHSRFSIFTWLLVLLYTPLALTIYTGLAMILFEVF